MAGAKRKIVLETTYPQSVAEVWAALTDKRALSQWLMETDFEPVVGRKFQFRAKPMPGWRGYVDAQVLELVREKRVSYSWQGMPEHSVMTVSWDLAPAAGGGTRLTLTHDGFDSTHGFLSGLFLRAMLKAGWKKMMRKLLPLALQGGVTAEERAAACRHS